MDAAVEGYVTAVSLQYESSPARKTAGPCDGDGAPARPVIAIAASEYAFGVQGISSLQDRSRLMKVFTVSLRDRSL
jgi:hypothetical protein